jgi:hypothetical protein
MAHSSYDQCFPLNPIDNNVMLVRNPFAGIFNTPGSASFRVFGENCHRTVYNPIHQPSTRDRIIPGNVLNDIV